MGEGSESKNPMLEEGWIFSGTIQYHLVPYRPTMHAKGYSSYACHAQ